MEIDGDVVAYRLGVDRVAVFDQVAAFHPGGLPFRQPIQAFVAVGDGEVAGGIGFLQDDLPIVGPRQEGADGNILAVAVHLHAHVHFIVFRGYQGVQGVVEDEQFVAHDAQRGEHRQRQHQQIDCALRFAGIRAGHRHASGD